MTEITNLPTEVIISSPRQSLGRIYLDWMPQPGHFVNIEGQGYTVLERHHHYQYKIGGYYLDKISIYVQENTDTLDRVLIDGEWVIGDISCVYNARSTLLRCAVNPTGPCKGCADYSTG